MTLKVSPMLPVYFVTHVPGCSLDAGPPLGGSSISDVAILDSVIRSDPNILGGTPVFRGTWVPLKNLVDYLAAGDSLDEFLDHFPSVKREQAIVPHPISWTPSETR
jgi:uncharacterized protein (DUF433 family)